MIELHNVDCMEYLATCEDNAFELAIVDPPYGLDVANMNMGVGKKAGTSKANKRNWSKKSWDATPPTDRYFQQMFRVSKNQIVWGANYFTKHLPQSKGWIFWNKCIDEKMSFQTGEFAFTSFAKTRYYERSFNLDRNWQIDGGKIHPTQKPIKLYEWLLMNYAKEGDRILDTHLGSGSIAIACHNLGFDLVGCELDTDYFKGAQKRLKQHQSQLRIPMQ